MIFVFVENDWYSLQAENIIAALIYAETAGHGICPADEDGRRNLRILHIFAKIKELFLTF